MPPLHSPRDFSLLIGQLPRSFFLIASRRLTICRQMTKTEFRAVATQSARGQTVSFLLKFRPACIECVQIFLCRFQLGVSGDEPGSVTGNRGIFERNTFALQALLGVRNTLLNASVFACFQVGELLLCLYGWSRRTGNRRQFGYTLVPGALALGLPGFPLPIVRKALRTALTIEANYEGRYASQEERER